MASTDDVRRFQSNRQDEIDSAMQYRAMAAAEPDETVARVYRELAAVEERHATFWETQLAARGVAPGPRKPSWRARVLSWTARKFGARMILPTVANRETVGRNDYAVQTESRHTQMPAQERSHARVLNAMVKRREGAHGSELARVEGRHRNIGGNALRAAVLGANDGLCSNLALVMGVAGATASAPAILIAGTAGLVAGACSMALGEWISVTSSRELAERELRVERDELELAPEEERKELQLIYEAKGVPAEEAKQLSQRLLDDPTNALDVLAREELGLDPDDLGGSPWTAAITSFVLFAIGALFPVLPFVFATGMAAVGISIAVSGLALFAIGAAITVFTGKPVWFSGSRQLVLGLAAAGVTYGIGRALGVALA
ncbi:MAG: VIT1/CCC1 transporter family protein [Deltaproteobacteria bacterium]|nr:VIT1/CCC1 transporter family protein [Deltaproteobacteria bacterium]MDQ3297671.1 VIT1/CCC1 transporter family protein [Myxococcota bacterium]